MAQLSSPEECAQLIVSIFVNKYKARPGWVLGLPNLLAFDLPKDDRDNGIHFALENGWFHEKNGGFELTEKGFEKA
mgnify:CR=1 FL=1